MAMAMSMMMSMTMAMTMAMIIVMAILETGKGLKKGPETILKISKMFQAFCSGLFPETGPKIKKNQPEIMKDQENLAKPSQNQ